MDHLVSTTLFARFTVVMATANRLAIVRAAFLGSSRGKDPRDELQHQLWPDVDKLCACFDGLPDGPVAPYPPG